jgi:hypothetical protein
VEAAAFSAFATREQDVPPVSACTSTATRRWPVAAAGRACLATRCGHLTHNACWAAEVCAADYMQTAALASATTARAPSTTTTAALPMSVLRVHLAAAAVAARRAALAKSSQGRARRPSGRALHAPPTLSVPPTPARLTAARRPYRTALRAVSQGRAPLATLATP